MLLPNLVMLFDPLLAALQFRSSVGSLLALGAGILILVKPDLLAKIVAIYLIIVGVIGLDG